MNQPASIRPSIGKADTPWNQSQWPATTINTNGIKQCTHQIIPFSLSPSSHLDGAGSVEVLEGLLDAGLHGLLTLADPDTGVVLLLVGLVGALGVTDLAPQVVDVVEDVVTDTDEVAPLEISVDVDLDDTVGDSLTVLLLGGAGTTVENEEDRLLVLATELLGDVSLVLAKELGVELDVARSVDTVNVAVISLVLINREQGVGFSLTRSQRQWRSREK